MRYHNRILILIAIAVVFMTTALAQPQHFRNAIFFNQSTGNSYWFGTDGYVCVMGGVASCNATTNLVIEKALYNKRRGFASVSDSITLAHTWGIPPSGNNSIKDWWGTFTNQSGYSTNYASMQSYMASYNVIIIKECYVWHKYVSMDSVLHDQARVRHVIDTMAAHPNKFFVWWTPAGHDRTNSTATKTFEKWMSRWMKDTLAEGLDSYGAFPKNVYIFDYFGYTTDDDGGLTQTLQCCPGGSGLCSGIPYDEHPNCHAVDSLSAIMIDEWFDAATYYENIHCNVNLTDEQPRLLKMAFQQTNDWDASRYDLVVGCLADSLVVPRAKAYNPNLIFVPTRDFWAGGAFVGENWSVRMPEYRVFNAAGGVVNSGLYTPLVNWSLYCDNFSTKGRYVEYNPDSLVDMITGTQFDGWHSDNTSMPPTLGVAMDYDRNGVNDDNTQKVGFSNAGWNVHDRNMRRNFSGGSSLGGGDTSLNQKLNIGWTFYGYYNCDTARKDWLNGWGIENPTGSNTAGSGNGWYAGNPFVNLLNFTRTWDRVARYKPSFFYMTVIMHDSRGDMMTRDSLMKARWILGMGALTKMPVAIHDDDAIGMDHSSGMWYDEMEKKLGTMKPDTVYRLATSGQYAYVWIAFYDSGCVIFRSGEDYATYPTITVDSSQIRTLYGYSGPYYLPWGNQDTVRNNGQVFSSIVLRAKSGGTSAIAYRGDAVFLYSRRDTVITPVIVDNAEYPTSAQCQPATMSGFTRDLGADERIVAGTYTTDPKQSGIYLNPTYSDACWHTSGATLWPQVYRQHYAQVSLTQTATATYIPRLNRTGYWTLYEWHGYRGALDATYQECDSVRVTISTATGDTVVYINQQINEGQWNLVGTFPYTSGASYPLVVSNIGTNTSEYVLADAYMWVWGYGAEIAPPEEPPQPPTLNSPCSQSGIPIHPYFSWNQSVGATSYRIQVSEYPNFAINVIDHSEVESYWYTPALALDYSTTYYWRMTATNEYGESDWSSNCSFTTTGTEVTTRKYIIVKPR